MPPGQPTLYKEEYCKVAIDTLSKGHSIAAVAAQCGVCRTTIYNWMEEHPRFLNSIKHGESKGQEWFEKILLAKVSGQKIKGFDHNRSSDSCLIFALKTRFHKDYGNKDKIELETKAPIILNYNIDDDDK